MPLTLSSHSPEPRSARSRPADSGILPTTPQGGQCRGGQLGAPAIAVALDTLSFTPTRPAMPLRGPEGRQRASAEWTSAENRITGTVWRGVVVVIVAGLPTPLVLIVGTI